MSKPSKSLAELASEQGIGPVADPDDLAAKEPLSDADYEAWMAAMGRGGAVVDADYPVSPELKALFDELAGFEHSADGRILRGLGQVLQRHAEMVRAEIEAEAAREHLLTDEEFDAWQDAIHGRRDEIGGKWDAPETSPYARLYAFAEGRGSAPSPTDVRELLGSLNGTNAMNGVYVRGNGNYKRRIEAVAALADTDEPVDPEALRRALAIGARDEDAASYPSTAQFRQWIADLQEQLEDAREEIEFLRPRATEH